MNKNYLFLTPIFAFIMTISVGCSHNDSEDVTAYISPNTDSEYVNTFKDLHLGILYDFDFELHHADEKWVTIWVEGYHNGKQTEPFHLTELSFGLSPKQEKKGHLGLGIINPDSSDAMLFIYAPGAGRGPHTIDNSLFISEGISTWDYAVGDEKVTLESGETKILGVYRQAKDSLETFDLQNKEAINEMINEDMTVLLLKIKVENKNSEG